MSRDTSTGKHIDREEAWDLIPWYVKGTLDAEEKAGVEALLAQDPELRAEVAMQRRLAEGVASLDAFSGGMERSLAAARKRIETEERRPAMAATLVEAVQKLLSGLGPRVLLPAGALAVALAVVLVLPTRAPRDEGAFTTLTAPVTLGTAPQLRVKVAAGATELQLRRLFMTHELQVVDGPSATGVYTLELAPGGDPDSIALALAKAPEIEFATVRRAP